MQFESITHRQCMQDDMWILVIQSFDQNLEALLGSGRLSGDLIAEIQDQRPVLGRVCLTGDPL